MNSPAESQARTRALLEQESSRYNLAGNCVRISNGKVHFLREDHGLVTPDWVYRRILGLTEWAYAVVDYLGESNDA